MRGRGTAIGAGLVALALVLALVPDGADARRSNPPVLLASESHENYSWGVSISRIGGRDGRGVKGRRRPCLTTGMTWRASTPEVWGSSSLECVGIPSVIAIDQPLIAEDEVPTMPTEESTVTVVALVLAPRVARVALTNINGTTTTHDARALTPRQAKRARLVRLRYVVFATTLPYCLDRTVTYDAGGRPLWNSGPSEHCSLEKSS